MDSRILKYEAILLEKDDLTLTTGKKTGGGACEHKCLDII
jgi:hypothetical protein